MKGKFIVIEGVDCTGKTTQAKLLGDRLSRNGSKVKMLDFPAYDTATGQFLTKYLKGELGSLNKVSPYLATLLYSADRYQFAEENQKALDDGWILIANRYTQSNMAYQGAKFKGAKRQEFMRWVNLVESNMPQPDDVVYLDLPVKVSQKLLSNREGIKGAGKDDIYENDIDYRKKVRKCYLEAADRYRWIVIDCRLGKDGIKPPQEIHNDIVARLRRRAWVDLDSFL